MNSLNIIYTYPDIPPNKYLMYAGFLFPVDIFKEYNLCNS